MAGRETLAVSAVVPVTFTTEELWLLQGVVRHEIPRRDEWHYPPASLDLNDAIADAIVACDDNGLTEMTLLLSRGDLFLLDYVIPQGATTPAGRHIGRDVLRKTFRARRELTEGPNVSITTPEQLDAKARLNAWVAAGMPKHPMRSRRVKRAGQQEE